MKSRRSKSLAKEVFDEYKHFLSKNHRYRTTEKHIFNGKEETALKPQRMTPHIWKLQYNIHDNYNYFNEDMPIMRFYAAKITFPC